MRIVSIDIGIKNLAIVILDSDDKESKFKIVKWDVISLCNTIPNCSTNNCKCKAKFAKKERFYCKKHTKNEEYQIPTINVTTLLKQSMKNLSILATDNSIEFDKSIKKNDLIELIKVRVSNTCFDTIETVNANNVNLVDIGINLKTECDKIFATYSLDSVDKILLENQISPIANRMKTIQGMIAQYFIDKGNHNIQFASAINKLKLLPNVKSKTTYAERKKLGIEYTKTLLEENNMEAELQFFLTHAKKDDLADCLLQGLYYVL